MLQESASRPFPAPKSTRRPDERTTGVLAVVVDRDDVDRTLPAAIALAVDEDRELVVAVIRPRPLWATSGALGALLVVEVDRQLEELLAGIRAATTASGVPVTVGVHLLAGLRGRRRRQVLEHFVGDLARRSDARPLGTWAV